MVDFRKSVLHAHKEEVEEDVVDDDDDDDDLDNENSLRSIEAKLDRALSDVSHLTVDNLSNSLSQSLGKKNESFSSNHVSAVLDSAILTDLKKNYRRNLPRLKTQSQGAQFFSSNHSKVVLDSAI